MLCILFCGQAIGGQQLSGSSLTSIYWEIGISFCVTLLGNSVVQAVFVLRQTGGELQMVGPVLRLAIGKFQMYGPVKLLWTLKQVRIGAASPNSKRNARKKTS